MMKVGYQRNRSSHFSVANHVYLCRKSQLRFEVEAKINAVCESLPLHSTRGHLAAHPPEPPVSTAASLR